MKPSEGPKPDYWDSAVAQLMKRDRILRKIIPQYPEIHLSTRSDPFQTLARAIIGQQISAKAGDAAWARFQEKRVHPRQWAEMDDEAVIAELTAISGIGRWTAEMFLIFNLRRPDILPLDDPGRLKAISLHYFSGEPVSRFEAREVAQAWKPWCTVATWYLWRSLDPVPVEN